MVPLHVDELMDEQDEREGPEANAQVDEERLHLLLDDAGDVDAERTHGVLRGDSERRGPVHPGPTGGPLLIEACRDFGLTGPVSGSATGPCDEEEYKERSFLEPGRYPQRPDQALHPLDTTLECKEEPTSPQPPQRGGPQPEALDCIICSEMVFEPLSLPCGHTVCMACWRAAQAAWNQRNKCPTCAELIQGNEFARIGVNVMLRDLLAQLYPVEYEARRQRVAISTPATPARPATPPLAVGASPHVLPGGLSTEIRHRVRSMQLPPQSSSLPHERTPLQRVAAVGDAREVESEDEVDGGEEEMRFAGENDNGSSPRGLRRFERLLANDHVVHRGSLSWDIHLMILLMRARLLVGLFLHVVLRLPLESPETRQHTESWVRWLRDCRLRVFGRSAVPNDSFRRFVQALLSSSDGVRSSLFWMKWPLWLKDLWNCTLADMFPARAFLESPLGMLICGAVNHFPLVNSWDTYRSMLRERLFASLRVWALLVVALVSTWGCLHLVTQTVTACHTESLLVSVISCPVASAMQVHAAWKAWAVKTLVAGGSSFAFLAHTPTYAYVLGAFFTRHPLLSWWCMLLGDLAATWTWPDITASSLLFLAEPRLAMLVLSSVVMLPIAPLTTLVVLGVFLSVVTDDRLNATLAPWAAPKHQGLLEGQLVYLLPATRAALLGLVVHVVLQTVGVSWFVVSIAVLLLLVANQFLARDPVEHLGTPWWYAMAKRTLRFLCLVDASQGFASRTFIARGDWQSERGSNSRRAYVASE
jgi:hypothetical protein